MMGESMSQKKTTHSGKRKPERKVKINAKPAGAVFVRSTLSAGRVSNTSRDGAQYTRRANRKARGAGFSDATSYAGYLLRLYEYAKKLKGEPR
jgi:hypothetical protein